MIKMTRGKYKKVTRMTVDERQIEITPRVQESLRKSIAAALREAERKYTQTANVPTVSERISLAAGGGEMPRWFADVFGIQLPPTVLLYRHPAVQKGQPVAYNDGRYNVAFVHPEDFDAVSAATGVVESSLFEYDQFLKYMHEKRMKETLHGDS